MLSHLTTHFHFISIAFQSIISQLPRAPPTFGLPSPSWPCYPAEPRRAGDWMMNEHWADNPAVITCDVALVQTKWKHISSLRVAFCCEKIGGQSACLMLELGDLARLRIGKVPWETCISTGAWRAEISCAGPYTFISRTAYGNCKRPTGVWMRPVRFQQVGAHGTLKPLNSLRSRCSRSCTSSASSNSDLCELFEVIQVRSLVNVERAC